jgi:hypothetical protein
MKLFIMPFPLSACFKSSLYHDDEPKHRQAMFLTWGDIQIFKTEQKKMEVGKCITYAHTHTQPPV